MIKRGNLPLLGIILAIVIFVGGCGGQCKTLLQENKTCMSNVLEENTSRLKGKPVVVAVGQIADRTGQFRGGNEESPYSTALSQAPDSILVSVLRESGIFRIPEVPQLQALIALKRIRNESLLKRAILAGKIPKDTKEVSIQSIMGDELMADLKFVFLGDITECNTGTKSGGLGFGIFGASANVQFKVAEVATDIRIVDSSTFEVLDAISIKRTVYAWKTEANLFRFFTLGGAGTMVEIQAGYADLTPLNLALRLCLQKTVQIFLDRHPNWFNLKVAMVPGSKS
jgi:curli production assembly/transport component CsgG